MMAFAVLTVQPSRASAQADQSKSRALFNVGAAAYGAGRYLDAIQAFEEAYRVEPRPGILFSMAQAHKKQFAVDQKPDHVRAAVKAYREYLAKVTDGGHRADAAEALAQLDSIEQRLGANAPAQAIPVPAQKSTPRLMASSNVKN